MTFLFPYNIIIIYIIISIIIIYIFHFDILFICIFPGRKRPFRDFIKEEPMYCYQISRAEKEAWCRIPREELVNHPDRKINLILRDTRQEVAQLVGNMMADEIIANNAAGKITKWVLPSGPEDQYRTFIARVNKERISLKNLYVFHMDEILDWQCRPYPIMDDPRSCQGRMLARFYGRIDPELNVPEEQRIWPRIEDMDYTDRKCEELGGIDTVWAGVGFMGLVAANESPESPFFKLTVEEYAASKTRITLKNPDTVILKSERTYGGLYERVDPFMLTIGFKIMLSAKRCVAMVTTGKMKQTVVRVAMFSEPTLEYPITLFPKYIPHVTFCCDRLTADHPLSHDVIPLSNENTGEGQ